MTDEFSLRDPTIVERNSDADKVVGCLETQGRQEGAAHLPSL